MSFVKKSEKFAYVVSPILFVGYAFFTVIFGIINYANREYTVLWMLILALIPISSVFAYYQIWFRFMRKVTTIHLLRKIGSNFKILHSDVIDSDKKTYEYNNGIYPLNFREAVLSSRDQPIFYFDADNVKQALSFGEDKDRKFNPKMLKTIIEDESTRDIIVSGIGMDKMAIVIIVVLIIALVIVSVVFMLMLKGVIK